MATIFVSQSSERDTLAKVGDWLSRHQRAISRVQWAVVTCYFTLLLMPLFFDLPDNQSSTWSNFTRFAQFIFWGLWWPSVILLTALVGRVWCGLLCPEGALSEWASGHGRGKGLPRWIQWKGWPVAGFLTTTIYGQLTSVYQYPKPAALILGGSTAVAMIVGYSYGKNKRVWCRFLCPVSGVFAVLAKISVFQFVVDEPAWKRHQAQGKKPLPVNCAPLVPLRTMTSSSPCHMCGRCSNFRGAIRLRLRSPAYEIVYVCGEQANPWESVLIITGLIGLALGAFQWAASPWFTAIKEYAATYLIDHQVLWPLESSAPWWLLTNYPSNSDVMTLLDGSCLLVFLLTAATVVAAMLAFCILTTACVLGQASYKAFHHLVQTLIPLAAAGLFVGLTSLTVSQLQNEGIVLWGVAQIRVTLLLTASIFTLVLSWRVSGIYCSSQQRRYAAVVPMAAAICIPNIGWALLFWVW